MDKMSNVILHISDYNGWCERAEHYYGSLIYTEGTWSRRIELIKRLDSKDCIHLNKKEGSDSKYRVGDFTERFNSEEEVIQEAIKQYPISFPKADGLVFKTKILSKKV